MSLGDAHFERFDLGIHGDLIKKSGSSIMSLGDCMIFHFLLAKLRGVILKNQGRASRHWGIADFREFDFKMSVNFTKKSGSSITSLRELQIFPILDCKSNMNCIKNSGSSITPLGGAQLRRFHLGIPGESIEKSGSSIMSLGDYRFFKFSIAKLI